MKAITLKQPWAWAVAYAGKDIENRRWTRDYRGIIAIHAGSSIDTEAKLPRGVRKAQPGELTFSAVIAVAEIVDVVDRSRSKWFVGPYGFVLRNVTPLRKPVRCSGWLGFWNLPTQVAKQVQAQLR